MTDGDTPVRTGFVTRRRVVQGLGAAAFLGASTAAYAVGIEPMRLAITRYRIRPLGPWPEGLTLRIVVLTDIHACEPWMSPAHIARIVETANGLGGDLIVLLGDYVSDLPYVTRYVEADEWAPLLGRLRAPLGVHAVLGNHDWWGDPEAQRRGAGPTLAGEALRASRITVLENDVVPLTVRGRTVWLAGLGDQIAFLSPSQGSGGRPGVDDLPATMAKIPQGAPAILLAHEPDIFPHVSDRIALTLSGHTHGGQINLWGWVPFVPSRYGSRYAYGHIREHADLVVSGGLGMSGAPIRLGMPPEIVVVELSGDATA